MYNIKKGQEAPFEGVLIDKKEYNKLLRDKEILNNIENKIKQ